MITTAPNIPRSQKSIPDSEHQPGTIYAANAARFVESYFSEPLTAYAVDWRDRSNLLALLEFVAPATPAPRNFQYATFSNVEQFLADENDEDERAMGAEFSRVEYTSDKQTANIPNKGLMVRLDRDQMDENNPNEEEMVVSRLRERLARNELRRAISLLSANAVNTGKTWDTTAGKDPDQDVLGELITAADVVGIRPNRVLFGDSAHNKRSLAHRAQDSAGGFASASMKVDELAEFYQVDGVMVGSSRYSSSPTARTGIVGNKVLMFQADEGLSRMDPSNIKRFVANAGPGLGFRVFREEVGSKFIDVTVEHYSLIAITSTLGIRQFTVS